MKQSVIDSTFLKRKSEELQIPFSNLLAGYVLEEVVRLLFESGFKEYLWIENSQILGLEQYRRKNDLILKLKYRESSKKLEPNKLVPGQKLSRLLGLALIAIVFGADQNSMISWKGNAVQKGNCVEVYLNAVLEEMEVPVYLQIEPVAYENLIPEKKKLQITLNQKKTVTYYQYPYETVLAENLFEVMEKMELVPDMKTFDTIYSILSEQAMNGRHVLEILTKLCEVKPVVKKEERLKEIASYADYSYMRKRWEKYVRHHKKEKISWQEVMKKFQSFMKPLWHAVCCDEIFFDDWMPELGRYLG